MVFSQMAGNDIFLQFIGAASKGDHPHPASWPPMIMSLESATESRVISQLAKLLVAILGWGMMVMPLVFRGTRNSDIPLLIGLSGS